MRRRKIGTRHLKMAKFGPVKQENGFPDSGTTSSSPATIGIHPPRKAEKDMAALREFRAGYHRYWKGS
jgi:hypothetical protein